MSVCVHVCAGSSIEAFLTVAYSSVYVTDTVGPGSFPFFLTKMKPIPNLWAKRGPNRNPRASRPAEKEIKLVPLVVTILTIL